MSSRKIEVQAFVCDCCGKTISQSGATVARTKNSIRLSIEPEGTHFCQECMTKKVEIILKDWNK